MNIESRIDMEYCSPMYLADLYLQYGSVEEVLKRNPDLPISIADFHRKVKDFGIVKGMGRSGVSIAEVLYFFAGKVLDPQISIERLYKNMPLCVQESASIATIHRIYSGISEKMTRRYAAALVITGSNPRQVLVADEKMQDLSVGKIEGSTSLLMSFGKEGEDFSASILRVLQREFSVSLTLAKKLTANGELASEIIPLNIEPFMYLHLLDIKVPVFHIQLPDKLCSDISLCASSYKMENHRFVNIYDILENSDINFRFGVKEIIHGYQNYRFEVKNEIPVINSNINQRMVFDLSNL